MAYTLRRSFEFVMRFCETFSTTGIEPQKSTSLDRREKRGGSQPAARQSYSTASQQAMN